MTDPDPEIDGAGLLQVERRRVGAAHRREPLRLVVDGTRAVTRPTEVSGLDQVLATFEDLESVLARTAEHP
ncbi:MAG TPA: hypothetical protein VGO23_13100 [Pseudonocardia sp.]|nr:hypothetical protein [Pseudonocardia sp.]